MVQTTIGKFQKTTCLAVRPGQTLILKVKVKQLNSNQITDAVLSKDNPNEGPCDSPNSPDSTSFSSDSRTPSPSLLGSHDYHKHAGVEALDMSSNSAKLGISSGTRKSVKTPESAKDSSHTRTQSVQSLTSKGNLQESRLEDINMPSDASVSGSHQVDEYHDGVASEETAYDGQGDDNDDDYRPTTHDIDRIEPVMNDSDHSDGHLTSSDIIEDEADVSYEGHDSSPHSETPIDSEGSIEETSSSDDSSMNTNSISTRRMPRGRGSFKCRVCPKVYDYKHNLKRHVKLAHSSHGSQGIKRGKRDVPSSKDRSRVFKCKECSISYSRKCHLVSHMKYKHKKQKGPQCDEFDDGNGDLPETSSGSIHQCEICSKIFWRACSLAAHLRVIHKARDQDRDGNIGYALRSPSKGLLFRCREGRCTKQFSSRSLPNIHLSESHRDNERNNSGDLHEELPAPSIDALSPVAESVNDCHTDSALSDHQYREKSNKDNAEVGSSPPSIESIYKCQICPKAYFRKCDLTKHVKSKHKVQEGGQEEICYSGQHDVPETSVGEGYQCMECSQGFSTKRALAKHMSEHRKDKYREDNHEAHDAFRPSSSGLRYKCKICPKSYSRKCDLTMHMKRGKHPSRKCKSSAVSEHRVSSASAMPLCSETFPNGSSLAERTENKHHDHKRNDCDKNDANVVSHYEAFQKALSCRFCQIKGLELIHRHERVCEQSPFLRLGQNTSKS